MKYFGVFIFSFCSILSLNTWAEREGGGGGTLDYRIFKGRNTAIEVIQIVTPEKLLDRAPEKLKEIYTEEFRKELLEDLISSPVSINVDEKFEFKKDEDFFTKYERNAPVRFNPESMNRFYYYEDVAGVYIHEGFHHFGFHHDYEKVNGMYMDRENFSDFASILVASAKKQAPERFVPDFLKLYLVSFISQIEKYNQNLPKKEKPIKYDPGVIASRLYSNMSKVDANGRLEFIDVNKLSPIRFLETIRKESWEFTGSQRGQLALKALTQLLIDVFDFTPPKNMKIFWRTPTPLGEIIKVKTMTCSDILKTHSQAVKNLFKRKDALNNWVTAGGSIALGTVLLASGVALNPTIAITWALAASSGVTLTLSLDRAQKVLYLLEDSGRRKRLVRRVLNERGIDSSNTKNIINEITSVVSQGINQGKFCKQELVKPFRQNIKWIENQLNI